MMVEFDPTLRVADGKGARMTDSPFGEVISEYSRRTAIEDGVLVDVSTTAREAGITFPVALTRAVWDRYVEVPEGLRGQDERGRLWDVVYMVREEPPSLSDEGPAQVGVWPGGRRRTRHHDHAAGGGLKIGDAEAVP